ncbi:hypothetical protein [Micromonospora sp. NBC_01813]|uniref:hypothetical protein n=1 Tax=Micromonospora sp. NBC_01813 TaxID=2975988 RepID=UPI002DD9EED4|nr:hypothetical protein [Micromonospora sp. NBC_01813]WSA08500.1 hypothetical protein OG958_30685 [Micromonospora sp. NBC_01813]
MAIEWVISGGRPIQPFSLVLKVEAAFKMVSDSTVAMEVVQGGEGGSKSAEVGEDFDLAFALRLGKSSAWVELSQFDFDLASGTCFGYVTPDRTKLAVSLGIVIAVCWHADAGGDLSGTGLGGRRLLIDEPGGFLGDLFRGATTEEKIEWVAEKLGCGEIRY